MGHVSIKPVLFENVTRMAKRESIFNYSDFFHQCFFHK